ncbi:MAG: hypothetical protein HZA93_23710 [Verrucomicrobia bacterium]|nr:hypothetical protein [Verrucomicrobiota bacterium]
MTDSQRNARAQRKLIRDYRGTGGGLAFHFDHKRGVAHFALHNGEGEGSSLTFGTKQSDELVEQLLRTMRAPEALVTLANIVRHATWDKDAKISRIEGELQTLRFRILHLEREAAQPAPYSDATALVPRPAFAKATAGRKGRAA